MSRNPLVPRLARDHPGYFKVVLSLVLVHVGMAIDAFLTGPQHSQVFRVIIEALGGSLTVLTVAHVVAAALVIAGLYWEEHFALLRYGCALSLVLFNALAVGFAVAAYTYDLSYYAAMASVTLSMSSLAAITEPPVQVTKRGAS